MPKPSTPRPKAPGQAPAGIRWISLENYAENRDSWTPSHRSRVDRDIYCGDGDEQWVKLLRTGHAVLATWHEGSRGALDGHWELDGSEIDVSHVGTLEARVGGPSGPSGSGDRPPARLLRAPKAFFELLDSAIEHNAESDQTGGYGGFSDWARHHLAIAAADELGIDPLDALKLAK